eukprot:SAG31_NODE_12687_length_924_cov_1.035152_1_plen_273_part_01
MSVAEDPKTPGFSAWPGNINELIFKLDTYDAALQASKGNVPEFINPKYTDATKTKFKSPTRLECMMQDFPRAEYMQGKKIGFTSVDRPYVRQYSPVKNNVKDAAAKQKSGLDPACACGTSSIKVFPILAACLLSIILLDGYYCNTFCCDTAGEMDVYLFFCDYLTAGGKGMTILPKEQMPSRVFQDIEVKIPPMVVLHPAFMLQLRNPRRPAVIGGSLTGKSTLIVDGLGELTLENVNIDGALVINVAAGAKVFFKDAKVVNQGWTMVALSDA